MTDKELLEYAAKAAGYELQQGYGEPSEHCLFIVDAPCFDGGCVYWNPLTDDGDAFRLMVKLRLMVACGYLTAEVKYNYDEVEQWGLDDSGITEIVHDFDGKDGGATATRRAIVRAAAEIGKGVK